MRLKDKVALVTGASRGIGKAIAERSAKEDAHVAVNYLLRGEVASVALFLASDESEYVTGSTYYVDGGLVQQVTLY